MLAAAEINPDVVLMLLHFIPIAFGESSLLAIDPGPNNKNCVILMKKSGISV